MRCAHICQNNKACLSYFELILVTGLLEAQPISSHQSTITKSQMTSFPLILSERLTRVFIEFVRILPEFYAKFHSRLYKRLKFHLCTALTPDTRLWLNHFSALRSRDSLPFKYLDLRFFPNPPFPGQLSSYTLSREIRIYLFYQVVQGFD